MMTKQKEAMAAVPRMATRAIRGARRRVRPIIVRGDNAVHRRVGLTVSEYDRAFPILRPIFPDNVEILADPRFADSCREIKGLTLLDTPRLANLWTLCQMCDSQG